MEYRVKIFGILNWKNFSSITEAKIEMRAAEHMANIIVTGAEGT